jgi:hypothetical protein
MVALTQNIPDAPANSNSATSKARPHHSNSVVQAVRIQRIVFETVRDNKLKPSELAGLARAWCDVNEERRKLSMTPLPKSVDPTKLPKRRRGSSQATAAPQEPSEPENPQKAT